MADANYAQTSGYDSDGQMDWWAASRWAAGLTVDGIDGWRLANTVDEGDDGCTYIIDPYQGVDCGHNITTHSELSNMFFNVLGNTSQYDINGVPTECNDISPEYCLTNTGAFSNLQPSTEVGYWSSTELALDVSRAWGFNMAGGHSGSRPQG